VSTAKSVENNMSELQIMPMEMQIELASEFLNNEENLIGHKTKKSVQMALIEYFNQIEGYKKRTTLNGFFNKGFQSLLEIIPPSITAVGYTVKECKELLSSTYAEQKEALERSVLKRKEVKVVELNKEIALLKVNEKTSCIVEIEEGLEKGSELPIRSVYSAEEE